MEKIGYFQLQIKKSPLKQVSSDIAEKFYEKTGQNKEYPTDLLYVIRKTDGNAANLIGTYIKLPSGRKLARVPAMVYEILKDTNNIGNISDRAVDNVREEGEDSLDKYLNNSVGRLRDHNPVVISVLGRAAKGYKDPVLAARAGIMMYLVLEQQAELDQGITPERRMMQISLEE